MLNFGLIKCVFLYSEIFKENTKKFKFLNLIFILKKEKKEKIYEKLKEITVRISWQEQLIRSKIKLDVK